jgi:hypothetical protein
VVVLSVGGKEYTRTVEYDPADSAMDQFRQFIEEITHATGIEAHVQEVTYESTGYTRLIAVLRADRHWKLENVEWAGSYPFLYDYWSPVENTMIATYGLPLQYLVWLHLDSRPAVVVGRTPLYGTTPQGNLLRVLNIGRMESGFVRVEEPVPAGLAASAFSPPPEGEGRTLHWILDPIPGSELDGIHYGHDVYYNLDGPVTARIVVPGATLSHDGVVNRSAETILDP